MGKDTHINARCTEDKKAEYVELALAFGYDNFSEFLIAVLDSMNDRYRSEGWESHLVHVSGDRIVAADAHKLDGFPLATAAFPVVAPGRFWNHLEEHCVSDDDR
jgi:hypothetical protein